MAGLGAGAAALRAGRRDAGDRRPAGQWRGGSLLAVAQEPDHRADLAEGGQRGEAADEDGLGVRAAATRDDEGVHHSHSTQDHGRPEERGEG